MLLDGERLTNAWVSDVQLPTFGYWPLPLVIYLFLRCFLDTDATLLLFPHLETAL